MAVNVTQKDKTLTEVIDWCRQHIAGIEAMIPDADFADYITGERAALLAVVEYCEKRLGYSGSMPLEVPNQSEQAGAVMEEPKHEMTIVLGTADPGEPLPIDRYQCSCGYSTRDEYEADSHINVQEQLKKGMS